jgi:hypothetical protein
MSIPNGLLSTIGSQELPLAIVGTTGLAVANSPANTFTLSYTGTPLTGTILSEAQFYLSNSYTPSQPWSTTYNASALMASITLSAIVPNSNIQITSALTATTYNGGVSVGVWVNGTGTPIGGAAASSNNNTSIYSTMSNVWQTAQSGTITLNVCAFYTPSTGSSSNNRILGLSDSASYASTIVSGITITQVAP